MPLTQPVINNMIATTLFPHVDADRDDDDNDDEADAAVDVDETVPMLSNGLD